MYIILSYAVIPRYYRCEFHIPVVVERGVEGTTDTGAIKGASRLDTGARTMSVDVNTKVHPLQVFRYQKNSSGWRHHSDVL